MSLEDFEVSVADKVGGIRQDDIIIALMGRVGSGKSYFIDLLTGQKGKRASDNLKSSMNDIEVTCVEHKKKYPGRRIVLVDTPGFDDTERSDMEVLEIIGNWLTNTYEKYVKLSGIIYLHRITDNIMGGSSCRTLRMFGDLVGQDALKNVILVSTIWSNVSQQTGEKRQKELQETFWAKMMKEGSRADRLSESTFEEAWRVVDTLVQDRDTREEVLLQREVAQLGKDLRETEAGRQLYSPFQKLLADQKALLKNLIEQIKQSSNDDNEMAKKLEREAQRIQKDFMGTFEKTDKARVPIGRRIWVFFFGTKAKKLE